LSRKLRPEEEKIFLEKKKQWKKSNPGEEKKSDITKIFSRNFHGTKFIRENSGSLSGYNRIYNFFLEYIFVRKIKKNKISEKIFFSKENFRDKILAAIVSSKIGPFFEKADWIIRCVGF